MAIPAKRFKVLDEETNVAITDFFSADHKNIFNSVNNEISEISKEIEDFINNMIGDLGLKDIVDTLGDAFRVTKDTLSDIADVIAMAPKDIDEVLGFLSESNPLVAAALSGLKLDCKKGGAGKRPYGKPYGSSMDCNGKKRKGNSKSKCSGQSSRMADLINRATGSDFNALFSDIDRIIKTISTLAHMGYDLSMCGVFSALASYYKLGNGPLTRAATGVLGSLTSNGNTLGVMDLASSAAGLFVNKENPNVVWDISKTYNTPSSIREREQKDLSDRLFGTFDLFDEGWSSSDHDKMLSVGKVNPKSDSMKGVLGIGNFSNIFGENDLNTAPSMDDMFMRNAIIMT